MNIFRELNHKRIAIGREMTLKVLSFFEIRKMKKQQCELEKYKTIGIVFVGKQIGDSLIMTSILRPLKESGYNVVVFCHERTNLILQNSKYVDKVIIGNKINDFKGLKKLQIDLLIDLSCLTISDSHRIIIKRKINPKYSIYLYTHFSLKEEPKPKELTRVHNEVINYKIYDKHGTYAYKAVLDRLGINYTGELEYDFNLDNASIQKASAIINKFDNKRVIIFNPYANVAKRSLSEAQIIVLLSFFNKINEYKTILIGEKEKIIKLPVFDNVYSHIGDLHSAVALISMSELIVSVDTSIVHFSRCFNKKMISIYANVIHGKFIDNIFSGPFYENAMQLFSPTKENKDFDVNILKDKIREVLDISQCEA